MYGTLLAAGTEIGGKVGCGVGGLARFGQGVR